MAAQIRFKCYFDDILLRLETIDDAAEKSLQRSEYANADGAELTDLGMKGKRFSATAWFIRDNYDDYKTFCDAVDQRDVVHNFVHPVFGLLFGKISSYNARHDHRKNCAVVDFTFEEELQGDFELLSPLVTPQVEDQFTRGQSAAINNLSSGAVAQFGAAASPLGSRVVDMAASISAQFVDVSAPVRLFVNKMEAAYRAVDSFCSIVTQPVNTLIATIDYGVTLPGQFIGAVAAAIDRFTTLVTSVTESPYRIMQSFYSGLAVLRNAVPGFEAEFDNIRAQAGALVAAQLFSADNENRAAAETIDHATAWNDSGEYTGRADRPDVLTINDLERTLVLVRTYLQQALDENRGQTVLAEMAATLLQHVNTVKIKRERLLEIDVQTETPLALICHRRGLGYAAAGRVLSVNPHIKNPTFVSGVISIYDR
ncbi:MAG: DNA circularization N-terminal domain-containing protein [Phycisphaerae bacterium]|jgi:prophage DNA circulation protein